MFNKKAEMGMGTLIIFIAMVLVAAVAAGVLISTTGSLQNKALATGKSTATEVGTSLNVIQVYAENGTDQDIEEFTAVMKLNAGSDPIRFADLLLSMNLIDNAADYNFDENVDCGNVWQDASGTVAGGDFGVSYAINGTNNKNGYLTKGDVVKMCFEAPRSVSESENLVLSFIPKVGSTRVVETDLPELIVDKRIDVYP